MKKRKLLRLKEFDYSSEGAYFVTIATHQRQHLFGRISGAEFVASAFGNIAQEKWSQIPAHFPHVSLDAFIVMPNHVHGIIVIEQSHLAVGRSMLRPYAETGHPSSPVRLVLSFGPTNPPSPAQLTKVAPHPAPPYGSAIIMSISSGTTQI